MNYKKARDLLDLNDKFNSKDIKKAYYKKALLYHPDKNPNGESMFKQINEAYIYLQNNFDPDTKRENLSFFYFLNNFILPNGEIYDDMKNIVTNTIADIKTFLLIVFLFLKGFSIKKKDRIDNANVKKSISNLS